MGTTAKRISRKRPGIHWPQPCGGGVLCKTLGWHRIECTETGAEGKTIRPVEAINAEILAKLDDILYNGEC